MSVILASICASRVPMQDLGPLPNGMKAPGWMEDFWDLLNLQHKRSRMQCMCVLMGACVCVCAHLTPLRVELFWISPAVRSVVQVIQRNGNKTAFLYWYSIDHSVLVASSVYPALSEHVFARVYMLRHQNWEHTQWQWTSHNTYTAAKYSSTYAAVNVWN